MAEELDKYRTELLQTVQKLNESYDKIIITLSGGALGLSVIFLKDVIKDNKLESPELLIWSWALFITSPTVPRI